MKIEAVRGMNDLLPGASAKWRRVESTVREVFRAYCYREVRTPVVEATELFVRGVGEGTDIVEKETYTFNDRNGKSLTLRPEGTAGVVRAFIDASWHAKEATAKWWYAGPMYRHERPQKGRYREFFQVGVEAFGVDDPWIDAEQLIMAARAFEALSIPAVTTRLNSLGCAECRPRYREVVREKLAASTDQLCDDCKRRSFTNPLRVLDCKNERCVAVANGLPKTTEMLCGSCVAHHDAVRKGLDVARVHYVDDPRIVRGLDYYTRSAFEFVAASDALGAQNAIGGGGRYDGLVAALGGPQVPGIGFAIGVERLVSVTPDSASNTESPVVFFAALGDAASRFSRAVMTELRRRGVACEADYGAKSLKAQMRRAGTLGAPFVAIVGDAELARAVVQVKRMATHDQVEVAIANNPAEAASRLADWLANA